MFTVRILKPSEEAKLPGERAPDHAKHPTLAIIPFPRQLGLKLMSILDQLGLGASYFFDSVKHGQWYDDATDGVLIRLTGRQHHESPEKIEQLRRDIEEQLNLRP